MPDLVAAARESNDQLRRDLQQIVTGPFAGIIEEAQRQLFTQVNFADEFRRSEERRQRQMIEATATVFQAEAQEKAREAAADRAVIGMAAAVVQQGTILERLADSTSALVESAKQEERRTRKILAVAVVALLVGIAGVVGAFTSNSSSSTSPPHTSTTTGR